MVDCADSAKLATFLIAHLEIDHELYKYEKMNENTVTTKRLCIAKMYGQVI